MKFLTLRLRRRNFEVAGFLCLWAVTPLSGPGLGLLVGLKATSRCWASLCAASRPGEGPNVLVLD